jgi:hypothetical protein
MRSGECRTASPNFAKSSLFEARVGAWARTQPAIRGAVVVGSRARPAPAADEWSHLDLILFTTAPESYAAAGAWPASFGPL